MHTLRRAARRLLIGATVIYCLGLLALAALWATAGQPTWWLELANTFALLLFAPLLPLHQQLAPGNQSGLGLISRYPFETAGESSSVRGQRVTIQVGGQSVTVLNVHLAAPYIKTHKIRQLGLRVITGYDAASPTRQVGRLVNEVDQVAGPLIVIGDFNTGDREPRYAELAARMHDAFRETSWGFGFTFPDHKRMGPLTFPFPLVRIDYVWSKGGALPAASHVECDNTGADHCFLVADLRVGAAEALNR